MMLTLMMMMIMLMMGTWLLMEVSAPRPDLRRFAVGGAQLSMIIRIGFWYWWGGMGLGWISQGGVRFRAPLWC